MNPAIRIGVGYHNHPDAHASGRAAAIQAVQQGHVDRPDLVLAFCSGGLDASAYLAGLQSVVGARVPVVGGSAVGALADQHLSYEGFPTAVAVLQWEGICRRVAAVDKLNADELDAGRRLGRQLLQADHSRLLLLFYDSVHTPPTPAAPPILNASPPLIKGIAETLGPQFPIFGGGVIGDYAFNPTWQFCGHEARQQSAVGALLGGALRTTFRITHGCVPKDGTYHTITRMTGSCIYEVDDRPVVELLDRSYGNQDWRCQRPLKRLAIGVNRGDRYGDYEESGFVNRLITGVLPNQDGIMLFEPDLQEGMEFQFMLRDGPVMIESARRNALALRAEVEAAHRTPRLGLYIDCAGRTADYSETLTEEADEVRAVFNDWNVPLLGFYSGVEVAPFLGGNRGLDWTGVLLLLMED